MAKQLSGYYKINVLWELRNAVRNAIYHLPVMVREIGQGEEHCSTQYAFLLYCHSKPTVPALDKLLRSYIGGCESDEGGAPQGGSYGGWMQVREVTQKELDEMDACE